jgi:hypothetical protein
MQSGSLFRLLVVEYAGQTPVRIQTRRFAARTGEIGSNPPRFERDTLQKIFTSGIRSRNFVDGSAARFAVGLAAPIPCSVSSFGTLALSSCLQERASIPRHH